MSSVLIVSGDIVDSNMGGVGVRNWELARALTHTCQVTLAIPNTTDLEPGEVHLVSFDLQHGDLRPYAQGVDIIILHGFVLHFHPYLRDLGKPLAVDLYCPSLLEGLVWHDQDDWNKWIPEYEQYLWVQLELLRAGDFFFCASEKQRDYWLGWLHAQKRINPHTYRQDPTLRKLISVVPYGVPDGALVKQVPVLKGIHPGIGVEDQLILWSGGLWDWLDPLSLIRAMAKLAPNHPNLKLYFMGTTHPNPTVSQSMTMPQKAIELSRELGVLDRVVFFGDWVPYEQRGDYLAEADLTVISHPNHVETNFSFRTRLLDSIWAGLPIISTQGDAISEWVEQEHLGITVPASDPEALAAAIEQVLAGGGKSAYAPAFARFRQALRWDKVVAPLRDFCLAPAPAPDKGEYLTYAEQIMRDKDAFLKQVVSDFEAVVRDRDMQISRYRNMLPLRIYAGLKRLLNKQGQ